MSATVREVQANGLRFSCLYAGQYEIVTMPGGHFMHREHPERFVKELLRLVEVKS